MKKKLYYYPVYFLVLLAIVSGIAYTVSYWIESFGSPGYVLMGIGQWSLETSLSFFTAAQIVIFFLGYYFFRTLGVLVRLPSRMKLRGKNIKFNRSQEALIAGLVDSAEGNWEKAESVLIKHASHSGAPLLHYLTAARAAQSRGAFDKRDEYLQKASAQAPDSSVAVGLTQAELHLSGNQFDQALETLKKLQSINPSHASVLKLLHQAYKHMGDWEALRSLLPSLHTNKVLMEAEIKLLETETFSTLLKQKAETANAQTIRELWLEIPNYIKKMPGISAIFFAAMMNAGSGADIEEELATALSTSWDQTLLALYGTLEGANIAKQLEMAERWLSVHPQDAVLLAVLGKLSYRSGDVEKTEGYLLKSIAVEPTVQAYQLLGDLRYAQGDADQASQCFKSGLEIASNEIVSRIDSIS
ncbi:heme biosynthesis protein HemY [Methylosoma difficile]